MHEIFYFISTTLVVLAFNYFLVSFLHCFLIILIGIAAMFLARAFGQTFFAAAARSKHYSTTAAAARNPLREFYEADRNDETPVVYGMKYAPLLFILNRY